MVRAHASSPEALFLSLFGREQQREPGLRKREQRASFPFPRRARSASPLRRFRPLSRLCTRSAMCLLFSLSHRRCARCWGVNGRATRAAQRDGSGPEMIHPADAAAGGGRRAKSSTSIKGPSCALWRACAASFARQSAAHGRRVFSGGRRVIIIARGQL